MCLHLQMTLCHTREIVQDLDGISLRDEPSRPSLRFDVVIANILIGPLMKLAPVLSLCVKDDSGLLCLCGLREEQLPALEAEYAKYCSPAALHQLAARGNARRCVT